MRQTIENTIFIVLLGLCLYTGLYTMYTINTTNFKAIITGVSK